jgi:hypothetical protein
LSPIVVVPKKNGKLKICIDFKKLNAAIKKDPYLLPFTNEVLNTITGYEAYAFLDGYSRYNQMFKVPKTNTRLHLLQIGGLWKVMPFGVKNDLQHIIK